MKSTNKDNIYLKYTGIILILVLLAGVYGYKYSQLLTKKNEKNPVKTSTASSIKPAAKTMTPGAACCKVSFSRARMLEVKNSHASITPTSK